MKHDELRDIAHNYAESLAGGLGLVLGHCETDIFGEASKAAEGHLTVDVLAGTISGGRPSAYLKQTVTRYRDAFAAFCEKHGAFLTDFRAFTVRYAPDYRDNRFIVTVEDARPLLYYRVCRDAGAAREGARSPRPPAAEGPLAGR